MRFVLCFLLFVVLCTISFAEVPEHQPSWDNKCSSGFQWSRGTASCKQADCPSGAGRTYTYECNCGEAWGKPFRTCYDPNRTGYVIACVAAGSKCPGEGSSGGGSAESCDVDSDCPDDYVCNPTTNKCEALGTGGCKKNSDCSSGEKCNLNTHRCESTPPDQTCNDVMCALSGGRCENDKCINKCLNVTCEDKCENGVQKSKGKCENVTGGCTYQSEITCSNSCASSGKRCRLSVGKVNFIDIDNIIKPLKSVRVDAAWYDERGALRQNLPTRYTDNNGAISFTNAELDAYQNGSLKVTVTFENQARSIQVVDASALGATPTPAQRTAAALAKYENTMVISNSMNNSNINLTLTRTMPAAKYAKIYYHSLEAIDFMKTGLKVAQKSPPERVYVDDSSTATAVHLGGTGPGAADLGIAISPGASVFTDPESPTNREWHEFGHHIMYEIYGYHYCCGTVSSANHQGYANPSSIDSYTEGFAEFMSMMMLDYYNYPKKDLYFVGATPFDMEINYRVTNGTMEEFAIASIYYDLLDGGAGDGDGIQLTRAQIWQVLSTKHGFQGENGTRQIESLWDAYRAFNKTNLSGLHDNFLSGYLNPSIHITKLDRIFVTHGVYADRNSDGIWEPGEEIGFTVKNNIARAAGDLCGEQFDVPIPPGTYMKLDVTDEQTGQTVEYYPIHVDVHVTGIEEGIPANYDYDFDTVPDSNGEININMPPASYNSSMVFSFGGDENYEQKNNTINLTSKEFYGRVNPNIHSFGSYSVTLKPRPKPIPLPCSCAPAFLMLMLCGVVISKRSVL